jgi:spore coat protein H
MRINFKFIFAGVAVSAALIGLCVLWQSISLSMLQSSGNAAVDTASEYISVEKSDVPYISATTDDENVYFRDGYGDDTSIVYMYMTIRKGNVSENSDNNWSELAKHSVLEYLALGIERDRVECVLQEGDENGPAEGMFGYGLTVPNGIVQIRGNTSSAESLKSYKIKLKPGAYPWRGQSVINLNKHPYDSTGFRNKLAYDLIRDIPNMISFRTQFVHLYVKDETTGVPGRNYQDYGLFTQIEQPNKTYLRNHGLDPNGHFYKPSMFEYYLYENEIKLKNDPEYNEKAFNSVIESKGNDDHSKLINMLKDVNDTNMDTKELFEKHFDRDNFFTWLAFQILTGDIDTKNRNYLLYSPSESEKWYYISWDEDMILYRNESYQRYVEDMAFNGGGKLLYPEELVGQDYGIANYWASVPFYARLFKEEEYRNLLTEHIEQLLQYLSASRMYRFIEEYENVTRPYKSVLPDKALFSSDMNYSIIRDSLVDEVEWNYQLYKQSLDDLMPFYMQIPRKTETGYLFSWSSAYSLNEAVIIQYRLELSRDYTFDDPTDVYDSLYDTEFEVPDLYLAPGVYFFRVMAYDNEGRTQFGADYYEGEFDLKHFGVMMFTVGANGEII